MNEKCKYLNKWLFDKDKKQNKKNMVYLNQFQSTTEITVFSDTTKCLRFKVWLVSY